MTDTSPMDGAKAATAIGMPLLMTKLHPPGWRPGLVSRPRLVSVLDRAAVESKLMLISAPAGFGKTTLLAEWLASSPSARRAAWVSLDRGDNDPARFWAYLISALQAQAPGIGKGTPALLHSLQAPPIESILAGLINEIAAIDDDLTLVLDDVHAIDAAQIHEGIAFLLDHLPPRLRLIIITRADPPLPLARFRSRGELTEIRAADLRFTIDEAALFLNDMMDLRITPGDVAALEARAEGWIAGLQLAALSMRDQPDVSSFIQTFAGDHRYIVDYLLEEVLHRQPAAVRDFLLQTSVLERLCGPLCDAVTGQANSAGRLAELERGNFFLIPLDDTRRWYRYHHLFADVLQSRLLSEQPELPVALHRRASSWYEEQGLMADAIRHALAAEDFAHAASLVELTATAMRRSRQEATLLGWIRSLPDAEIRRRPVLSALYAGVLLSNGRLEGVDVHLRVAERLLGAQSDAQTGMIVADNEEFQRLPGSIAIYRAGHALALGDVAATIQHARRAIGMIATDDHLYLGAASALLGLAYWSNGQLASAYESYAEGMAQLHQAGYTADVVGGSSALADIRIAQGRLRDAMAICQRVAQLGTAGQASALRGTADIYVEMSEVQLQWNNLEEAERLLASGNALGESLGFPRYPYRRRVAQSHLRAAQDDFDGALTLIEEAERCYVSDMHPNVRPLAAEKARIWIAQGRLDDALNWAHAHHLPEHGDTSYLREFEQITFARLLLAQGSDSSIQQASSLLERLRDSAETGERMGSVLEIVLVQALIHQQSGDQAAAIAALEHALELAEPEGVVRIFLDEGAPMRRLLQASAGGDRTSRAARLLRHFETPRHSDLSDRSLPAASLAEPLTPREIEILRLIAAGLRNQEIADRLFISLPTVKRHIANAYGKLGVTHRTEALARASVLGLL